MKTILTMALEEFRLKFDTTKAILNGYINYLKKAKGN